jgi:hypothetical protein
MTKINQVVWLQLVLLFAIVSGAVHPAEAERKYVGSVERINVSTSGLTADLKKFWGKTTFPKRQRAQVIIIDGETEKSARIGMSPSIPITYEDVVPLTRVKSKVFHYRGLVPADSNWERKISVRVAVLSPKKIEFRISETDVNESSGYRLHYRYRGVLDSR